MAAKPTGWNRIVARLQGEVPAAELEAFRRASGPVLELLDQVERRRLECSIDRLDPWTVPPATRAAFLCAWNAFVLQTLGDELLDADYRLEPRTPHFVPPATAQQVLRFYEPVEGWVNRAWQAQANPDYRLGMDVPTPLPAWEQVDPLPPAHLDGLLHAIRSVRHHADAAVAFLPATPPQDARRQAQLNRMRQLYASAQARARYAEELCGSDPVAEVRGRAGEHARAAIEQLYLLGQLVADPELAAHGVAVPGEPRRDGNVRPPAALPARRGEAATPVSAAAGTSPAPHPAGPLDKAPRLHPVTRHDPIKGQTITDTAEAVEFTGRLAGEMHFALRLSYVRSAQEQSAVLRVTAWANDNYPNLNLGSLTVRTDGENTVLQPMPDHEAGMSDRDGRLSFHEHLGYRIPHGLLAKLVLAEQVGLIFKTYRGTVDVDDPAAARFHAYCRGFFESVVNAVELREDGGSDAS